MKPSPCARRRTLLGALLAMALLGAFERVANAAAEPPPGYIGSLPAHKLLFLGNSITLHPPLPSIGWTNNWGMAASAATNDYVHLLSARIGKAARAQPEIRIRNIGDFERRYNAYDVGTQLKPEADFSPDIIIVAIGENVPSLTNDAARVEFAAAFGRLLAHLNRHGHPAIFVRSSFWPDPAKDQILRQASTDAGATFVDISSLARDASNVARSERKIQHAGVAVHPGDKGMRAIADAIWAAILKRAAPPAGTR